MKLKSILLVFNLFFLISIELHAGQGAVVSAHKLATESGIEILKKGGTAAEAAIATAFTLSVVEPAMSGIGGGGFLLYYEKSTNKYFFVDYREAAPLAAKNEDYLKENGQLGTLHTTGGKAVAVPGFVAGMDKIHKRFGGKIPWKDLLSQAEKISRNGFQLTDRQVKEIKEQKNRLSEQRQWIITYFNPTEQKKPVIVSESQANMLSTLMNEGAQSFYQGNLSQKILADLKKEGSLISADDLKKYQVYFAEPKRFPFRDLTIITAPLPSTGGLLLEQMLFAARDASARYSSQNFPSFLEKELTIYFEKRKQLRDKRTDPFAHTTHLCVVDKDGNIASMTNSINLQYGSGVILEQTGILLNNHMSDFDFDVKLASKNQIFRGNRPLSSMSPTIILRGFDPYLVIGTPGGLTIPINLFEILNQHFLEKVSLSQAIKAPKFYYFPDQKSAWYEDGFQDHHSFEGLKITPKLLQGTRGNVQAILFEGTKPKTYSDPRGEGYGSVIP